MTTRDKGEGVELSVMQKQESAQSQTAKGNAQPDVEEMQYEFKDFKWKDPFTKKKYIPHWIFAVLLGVIIALVTINHAKIVEALRPISFKLKGMPGGFIIPIIVLIVISFPPLFGHEIIGLLVGVVWGLWVGFAIVAVGTFLGEVGTWYAFKYAFRRKAMKLEKTNITYGALARLARDGGFWIILLIRFSVIPTHISTAVFSTTDVKFWHFAMATFLTSPKQITIVYVGVLLTQKKQDPLVNGLVLLGTLAVTLVAGVYIYIRMRNIKKAMREQQEAKLAEKKNEQERLERQAQEPQKYQPPQQYPAQEVDQYRPTEPASF
ncbi:hypothetical protein LZ554_003156 [Drepanopeziza brunnea f. sp. 'monogermtubi']|nr:hypothetical protein LZ554_003156 [Drepanopeziza brunnea f. sp. 'monogermtubi']